MAELFDVMDKIIGGGTSEVKDRGLDEKSFLRFMYPMAGTGGVGTKDGTILTLPFFENITIDESQRPRWSKHDILGRNGQLFTFTGSQSRTIKLTFNMTFPHIMKENPFPIGRYINGEDVKANIRKSMKGALNPAQKEELGWDEVKDEETRSNVDDFSKEGSIGDKRLHTIKLITWWVNVVRSSTINNGRDPMLGPPIVMLKHGPLYRDVKFICQGYNINFDEMAGQDLATLLNRRITVSMDLAEVKFGDEYAGPGLIQGAKADSNTGWHHLMEYGIMDPGNDPLPARQVVYKDPNYDPFGKEIMDLPSPDLPAFGQPGHPRGGLA
tara:strand:- start:21262 stop:22239 length:978 start_codon:yes stop_codon:yes gene_type:complete